MLRRFLQCSNMEQRLEVMKSSSVKDWSGRELDAVLRMLGMTEVSENTDAATKYQAIIGVLSGKVEDRDADQQYMQNLSREVKSLDQMRQSEVKSGIEEMLDSDEVMKGIMTNAFAMKQMVG